MGETVSDFRLEPSPQPQHVSGEQDFWPTPPWVTQALLRQRCRPDRNLLVVEPSAGEGGIVEVLLGQNYRVEAVEARTECHDNLGRLLGNVKIARDWLLWEPPWEGKFSIVGNPPYRPASVMLQHVMHAVQFPQAVFVAMLLPINFLCSMERYPFHVAYPMTALYPLAKRPSTSGDGAVGTRDLAWFVWVKEPTYPDGREIRVLVP
jgi:hypothetical protein